MLDDGHDSHRRDARIAHSDSVSEKTICDFRSGDRITNLSEWLFAPEWRVMTTVGIHLSNGAFNHSLPPDDLRLIKGEAF